MPDVTIVGGGGVVGREGHGKGQHLGGQHAGGLCVVGIAVVVGVVMVLGALAVCHGHLYSEIKVHKVQDAVFRNNQSEYHLTHVPRVRLLVQADGKEEGHRQGHRPHGRSICCCSSSFLPCT